jgi:2-polyprenyl-3-methyl-5-hydroxy-6-metoxy-1,4-benzoquinol methylase
MTTPGDIAAAAASDPGAVNDEFARAHSIDDYYARSPLPIRLIERRRLRLIRDMVAEQPSDKILEVGAGGGHVLRMFRLAKLTAVDVSEVFLDNARKNLAGYNCEFVKGEITKLGLPRQSFDKIICTEVLEHTANPEEILAELAALLKSDGRAVITVPNDPLINGLKATIRRMPVGPLRNRINWGGDHYHIHQWTPSQFRALLSKFFTVEVQRAAPFDWLAIRACFLCRPKR